MRTQTIKTAVSKTDEPTFRFSLRAWWSNAVKRAFDILLSGIGLLFLSPVFGLLSILIKRDSPGPVFYRGLRSGRRGRHFRMLKFRTMHECPQSYQGPPVTAEDDPRVTPYGRWLRDTKLNELPQLWNVLKGEMSLVGPRPEDPEIVAHWPEDLRREILSLRPGVTSPASVLYRQEEKLLNPGDAFGRAEGPGSRAEGPGDALLRDNGGSLMHDYLAGIMPDKLRLDRLYVHNRSFLGDLDLIFLTLTALLPRLKQLPIPENTLHWGPLSRFVSRYISWFIIDNFVAFAAVGITGLIWRLSGPLDIGLEVAIGIALSSALLFSLVNARLGLGNVSWRKARPVYALDLAFSSGLTTLILLLLDLIWPFEPRPLLPPGMLLVAGLLAFLGFLTVRYRDRLVTGLASRWLHYRRPPKAPERRRSAVSALGERVLIVGAGEGAQLTVWLLHKGNPGDAFGRAEGPGSRDNPGDAFGRDNLSTAFSIIGMVDDDPRKQGMQVEGYTVLGTTRQIPDLVARQDVGLILFAISNVRPKDKARILELCRQTPARLVIIPDLLQLLRRQLFALPEEENLHEETLA